MKTSQDYIYYLIFLAMCYVSVDLSSMVFSYKVIEIKSITVMASSLIFPLTYSIMDIIAEVYGYRISKKIILFSLICDITFSLITSLISQIPSATANETNAYILTLGFLTRIVLAQSAGILAGGLINISLLSKLKIMTKGRYFWLRSIGSSIFGETAMLIISIFIALIGVIPLRQLILIIFYTLLYKIIFAVCIAPIISLITSFIKLKINANARTEPFIDQLNELSISAKLITDKNY